MIESKTVILETPIVMGEQQIKEIIVSKATVGHLRGISLTKLFSLETDELVKLLPRITQPSIPQHCLLQMEVGDFTQLISEAISFLAPSNAIQNE